MHIHVLCLSEKHTNKDMILIWTQGLNLTKSLTVYQSKSSQQWRIQEFLKGGRGSKINFGFQRWGPPSKYIIFHLLKENCLMNWEGEVLTPPSLPPPGSATNMYELHNATLDHHKNNFCFDDNTLSNGDSPLILALK